MNGLPPTQPQREFVQSLQARLRLTNRALDTYCEGAFGKPFIALDRNQVSRLLDEMQTWKTAPAQLQRAMGQLDMFGGEA